MKKICKIICWILGLFIGFILLNLAIGTIKYGGTKAYSEILNQKDWQQSLSEISLLKPKTRIAMFYKKGQEDIEKGVEQSLLNDSDTDIDAVLDEFFSGKNNEEDINRNPYDPDYEDEFNSFFGESHEESPEVIPVQEIEDLEQAGFIVDEDTED